MAAIAMLCTAEIGLGIFLLFIVLLFVAVLSLVLVMLRLVFGTIAFVARGLWKALIGPDASATTNEAGDADPCYQPVWSRGRICGNAHCGHLNRPDAVYCSRCGWKLRRRQ